MGLKGNNLLYRHLAGRALPPTKIKNGANAVASTGSIVAIVAASLIDGELFNLSDGVAARAFEFRRYGAQTAGRRMVGTAKLTAHGISVPTTIDTLVTGGGSALQDAITAAASGTRLLVNDNLDYDPITITNKTNLVIEAAPGKTPTITADTGIEKGAVKIATGNVGVALRRLRLVGNGNHSVAGNQTKYGILNMSDIDGTLDKLIVQECIFTEIDPANGSPAIQIAGGDGTTRSNVAIVRCVATDCGGNSNVTAQGVHCIEVSGVTNVWVQGCTVQRSALARASSHMRGIGFKSINVLVEHCLVNDIGTAGSNEAYKVHSEANFGTALGTHTFKHCVAYNVKRGFRINCAGATMNVQYSLAYWDIGSIIGYAMGRDAGTQSLTDSVLAALGAGTAFNTAIDTENHNDVYNFATLGITLDATDLTADPTITGTASFDFRATEGTVIVGATDSGPMGVRYEGTADEMRDATIASINDVYSFAVTASDGGAATVDLVNDVPGAAGNVTITETVAAGGFSVSGMSGGSDDTGDADALGDEIPAPWRKADRGLFLVNFAPFPAATHATVTFQKKSTGNVWSDILDKSGNPLRIPTAKTETGGAYDGKLAICEIDFAKISAQGHKAIRIKASNADDTELWVSADFVLGGSPKPLDGQVNALDGLL